MGGNVSYLERLFTASNGRDFVITLSIIGLTGLFLGYLLVADFRQQHAALQQQNSQLQQRIMALKQQIHAFPVTVPPMMVSAPPAFSVTETLMQSGGRLIRWQSGMPQATLELSLAWERVPDFFSSIAHYRGLTLPSFTLQAAGERVRVDLTLEFSHEHP